MYCVKCPNPTEEHCKKKRISRSRCRLAAADWREPNEVSEMKHTSGWGSDSPTERSTLRKM